MRDSLAAFGLSTTYKVFICFLPLAIIGVSLAYIVNPTADAEELSLAVAVPLMYFYCLLRISFALLWDSLEGSRRSGRPQAMSLVSALFFSHGFVVSLIGALSATSYRLLRLFWAEDLALTAVQIGAIAAGSGAVALGLRVALHGSERQGESARSPLVWLVLRILDQKTLCLESEPRLARDEIRS